MEPGDVVTPDDFTLALNELLDTVLRRRSAAALAKHAGVAENSLANWRSGRIPQQGPLERLLIECRIGPNAAEAWQQARIRALRTRADGRPTTKPHAAATGQDTDDSSLGRPINQCDPHDLEVHPAGGAAVTGNSGRAGRVLSGYVTRAHDRVLAEAVRDVAAGCSRLVVLIGSSSTGKTRACWEAVQPLAPLGWRLWHPFDPSRVQAALANLARVGPQTVVWLNEAQHYLGDPNAGEHVAAALHALLTEPDRGPILVLGTLWPQYEAQYTELPSPEGPDPHSRTRELLAGRTIPVPEAFDGNDLRAASEMAQAGDNLLADALTRACSTGRLAQDLAGAPELLRRYQHAEPPVRTMLHVAMDARRLGVGLHLPRVFLRDAVEGYITDEDWETLDEDWTEAAFTELARPVHGKQAPLRRTRQARRPGRLAAVQESDAASAHRLADYLEQHGSHERQSVCPPATFWDAALEHLPDDAFALAVAAQDRGLLRHAALLYERAAAPSRPPKPAERSGPLSNLDWSAMFALSRLHTLSRDALPSSHPRERVDMLVLLRAEDPSWDGAEDLIDVRDMEGPPWADRENADYEEWAAAAQLAGDLQRGCVALAAARERAADTAAARRLYQAAADAGSTLARGQLARICEPALSREEAEDAYIHAARQGDSFAKLCVARMHDHAQARAWIDKHISGVVNRAVRRDSHGIAALLVQLHDASLDEDAKRLAADCVSSSRPGRYLPQLLLADLMVADGRMDEADACYTRLVRHDRIAGLAAARLAEIRGDLVRAERLYGQLLGPDMRYPRTPFIDFGVDDSPIHYVRNPYPSPWDQVRVRERSGNHDDAWELALATANSGDAVALWRLAADRLRRSFNTDASRAVLTLGIEPDGSQTLGRRDDDRACGGGRL